MISADVAASSATSRRRLSPGRVLGIGLARPYQSRRLARPPRPRQSRPEAVGQLRFRRARCRTRPASTSTRRMTAPPPRSPSSFYGFGRESDDFVYFFIGPAIGGGVILDGRLSPRRRAAMPAMSPCCRCRAQAWPPRRRRAGPFEILLARASVAALMRHLDWHGHRSSGPEDLPAAIAACPRWLRGMDRRLRRGPGRARAVGAGAARRAQYRARRRSRRRPIMKAIARAPRHCPGRGDAGSPRRAAPCASAPSVRSPTPWAPPACRSFIDFAPRARRRSQRTADC